jgi:hypothetical protein
MHPALSVQAERENLFNRMRKECIMNEQEQPIVEEVEVPVVLTEEEDESESWPIEVQFYFGQGLYGERDADLAAQGMTL